jgi:diacylglycerol kinase (ATP)
MIRFLVNPAAGGGRARNHLSEIRRRASELDVEVRVSCSGPDLTAQARQAVEDGVERLLVAGGDGTMHLVVQALAESSCCLGLLPIGRGNDYASALGVPRAFNDALDLALSQSATRIDLGRAGQEWFAFYAGVGFDSEATKTAEGHPRWWPDAITYNVAVVRTLFSFRPPLARVEYEGGSFEGEVMFTTACNGPQFGGGMLIAPAADLSDGFLDLVIVRAVGKAELLRIFPRVYRGAHVDHPAVSIHRTRWARLCFEPTMLLGSDGELVGHVGDDGLEIRAVPRALDVVAGDLATVS